MTATDGRKPRRLKGLILSIVLWPGIALAAASTTVSSPDGSVVVTLMTNEAGQVYYKVDYRDEALIDPSQLGLEFRDRAGFVDGMQVVEEVIASRDSEWEQPWGERRVVRDRHNELTWALEGGAGQRVLLRIRVFDDGLGFRYEVPRQSGFDDVVLDNELTEFRVPRDATTWWIPARGWNRYEFLHRELPVVDITLAHTPVTMRLRNGAHVSLHEAALSDYPAYVIEQQDHGALKTNLTPWSDGALARLSAPFVTPWRTIQVSPDAVGLLNSSLILNLNEPNKLGDVSWVEPGKYIGIWWSLHMGLKTWGSGDKHGATTAEAKRHIDFAADHGFAGVLVEGWNTGWDGNWIANGAIFSFTQAYPDFDIEAVASYALDRGVRLVGHHETSGHVSNYEAQMADAYDLYESLGVRQVKTGYVAQGGQLQRVADSGELIHEWHDGQFAVRHFEHVLVEAAKRKISINTHEPVKATGMRRTYPNWISREGARGQEYNGSWSRPNPPSHNSTMPFTRLLGGPLDFTPGIFDLTHQGADSPFRVQSTLTHQLALYLTLYSPIQMAADLPENYLEHADAFQFIKDVPTDWEESIAVAGEVGEFVVFARQERGGEDWFLGATTNEDARSVTIPLDFLQQGKRYRATVYRDGDDAHWDSNPYDYVIEEQAVTAKDSLELKLAAGGGTAIRFEAL